MFKHTKFKCSNTQRSNVQTHKVKKCSNVQTHKVQMIKMMLNKKTTIINDISKIFKNSILDCCYEPLGEGDGASDG